MSTTLIDRIYKIHKIDIKKRGALVECVPEESSNFDVRYVLEVLIL